MSVTHDEAIAVAAHAVHDKVWFGHWKEGVTQMRASLVVQYVREIRVEAHCREEELPSELLELMEKARKARDAKESIAISEVIIPLKLAFLPAA